MTDLNPQPLPPREIRVQVADDILGDLERFQKVQATLLGHLGCQTCTSGLQFIWQNYENWVVDELGAVRPVAVGQVVSVSREA